MKLRAIKPIIIDRDFIGPLHTEEEYKTQTLHWLYLWKLEGLDLPTQHDPIKLGIAKEIYKANFEAGLGCQNSRMLARYATQIRTR